MWGEAGFYTKRVSEVSLLFWRYETSGHKHNGGRKRVNIWRFIRLMVVAPPNLFKIDTIRGATS